ncbi:MAG: hypothetical protein KatS3mg034_1592 [Vicingaceae bacterium]|nr:MAG: hypothetical protein KatS3mg034_0291 [Vicingaceae bacterium]GIV41213.1 MAG: hypothetical protein KatS3mg034_0523 [Vicingaceae bacterium]GIV42282.1 MAG: hypothetical protein KatS3mg034_1592 [Vicingaceae bacterium]
MYCLNKQYYEKQKNQLNPPPVPKLHKNQKPKNPPKSLNGPFNSKQKEQKSALSTDTFTSTKSPANAPKKKVEDPLKSPWVVSAELPKTASSKANAENCKKLSNTSPFMNMDCLNGSSSTTPTCFKPCNPLSPTSGNIFCFTPICGCSIRHL